MKTKQERTRNFCIIAHIDHGKSTLADRLIEKTGLISKREMTSQVLDKMDLEQERGITIKLQAVRLVYHAKDGEEYYLNLIDTPGHVDFTYEVSRSLAACEGAILIVDATQGIQAQTMANVYLALENDLEIIPVINKIDLPSADPEMARREIEDYIGLPADEAPLISAKEGLNIDDVLEAIVRDVPPPEKKNKEPLRGLIFDSYYDQYKGVVISTRIVDGEIKKGTKIKFYATGKTFEVEEVGIFTSTLTPTNKLESGDVGYICASIKNVADTRVGDTIMDEENPAKEPLPGYKSITPMVYCGIYPADGSKYEDLKEALGKLKLNDASLLYEPETSVALGFGFRCGFLGLLHLEVTQQRIDREYNLDIVTTTPSVIYHVTKTDGSELKVDNPTNLPPVPEISFMEEPFVDANIMLPSEYVGAVMEICQGKRGIYKTMDYIDENRVNLKYEMPLNEIIYDFFDTLKSRTKGYASLDYELLDYRKADLVKLDILLNGEIVDALSFIVHREKAQTRGRQIVKKLKEEIPRQMFEIPIQAAIGGKVIARETVRALRKDVLSKCYGGDITRKKKLLEKQKEGKKKMRQVGKVEVPQEAFTAVLKLDE
ncbi:translation elongation factor 4 [Anaerofustis stercorihominis]|uniref:Elongation factor 4 n=2 Tax=Anaerofustis stercorihominis TaxID=214853 RepID=B1CBQ3_9FIRM|nr:translation elongation factor 4 [Anaerofustis stercorihominis]EDS71700.1 GTP-binding protein LepA [Anaerofustis stercorihominis DSM 17244]MCQ4796243.1 translation elongation factor 4 [Anaerofustis stercorihominis]RGD75231.1 elongation factor 4 [Anaerofustis stercorihominis]